MRNGQIIDKSHQKYYFRKSHRPRANNRGEVARGGLDILLSTLFGIPQGPKFKTTSFFLLTDSSTAHVRGVGIKNSENLLSS